MKNKKATGIPTTIVFIGAIFALFIIFIIYFVIIGFLNIDKIFGGENNPIDVQIARTSESLAVRQELYSLLEEQINFNGKQQKVYDAILSALDPYFEIKLPEHAGVNKGKSIADLYEFNTKHVNRISMPGFLDRIKDDGFDMREYREKIGEPNQVLGGLIAAKMRERCEDFYFLIPQGFVDPRGLMSGDQGPTDDPFGEKPLGSVENWVQTVEYTTYYRGKEIIIKFRVLRKCIQ